MCTVVLNFIYLEQGQEMLNSPVEGQEGLRCPLDSCPDHPRENPRTGMPLKIRELKLSRGLIGWRKKLAFHWLPFKGEDSTIYMKI